MREAMIRYEAVTKSFDGGATRVVDRVSFDVREGEILVLLGSSGSGKTTLLRMTNRLEVPTSGRILFDGRDVGLMDPVALRRRIGYVFQGIGLFPHMTVSQNVSVVPQLLGWSLASRTKKVRETLDRVGLDPGHFEDRYPDELSGGQKQRVGVARALVSDPPCLLMDEPFSALDAITRESLQLELLDLQRKDPRTILFVTHDIFEALALGDRIAVLHEGRVEQIDTKGRLLSEPRTEFVRRLFDRPAREVERLGQLLG